MAIRFFDMFAGIGGFRSGLEAAGGFECAGHCEIDKYAKAEATGLKDAQLYKMAGNAVSVPVVSAIGRMIRENDEEWKRK